jgi:hypothetical protein
MRRIIPKSEIIAKIGEKRGFFANWMQKGDPKSQRTSKFDLFFANYVLYNAIYSCARPPRRPPKPGGRRGGERKLAVDTALRLLGAEAIANDEIIQSSVRTIVWMMKNEQFHLVAPYTEDATNWDSDLLERLESDCPERYADGVLEMIYQVRCNLFHGEKAYRNFQEVFLRPCVAIIRRVNEMIMELVD